MPRWCDYLIPSSCDDNDMLLCVHKLYYGWLLNHVYHFLVYRIDFEEKVWVKMKNIGETAIFLCGSMGTICSTRGNNLIKKVSIYFTKDRCVYLFDLKTQKISIVSLPCPHVRKEKTKFCWLTLPYKCNWSICVDCWIIFWVGGIDCWTLYSYIYAKTLWFSFIYLSFLYV